MRILHILLLLLICPVIFPQKPYLYFSRITTQNGLSHNKVNCIIQDKRGFIWIGTEDGLNRFDGQYFTIFRNQPQDITTISGNIINDMLEDKDGIIWIATADGGLTRYDYRLPLKRQFKQYKHIEGDSTTIPVNIINKLIEDNYGYLWLATSGSYVLRFNKKTERFEIPARVGTRSVASLSIDDRGILWVGKIGGSFLKINTATLQYEMDKRYTDLYAKLPHATIISQYKDKENNIWFGSWDKVLYKYNAKTQKEEVFKKDNTQWSFPEDEATSFSADKKDRLWIGGKYFGLTIYDKQQQKFYNYQHNASQEGTIADNCVNAVYTDNSGTIWLGTNKGVCTYNPGQQPFEQTFLPKQKKDITIYDFYKDTDDKLWIATSEGIFFHTPHTEEFTLKKFFYKGEQLAVTKFFKDEDGTFYIGTSYSLFKYDPHTQSISLLPNTAKDQVMNKIIDSRVVSVIRDTIEKNPVLLVSPYGHYITYYDLFQKQWVSRMDSVRDIIHKFNLRDNLIRKIYKTRNGHVWLATSKYGLGDWKKQSLPKVNHLCNNPIIQESISDDNVYDMTEDEHGNLWVSTYGGGLNYFNTITKKFTHINATNNLLEGIQTDKDNNVWMISNGDVHKYDPKIKVYTNFPLPDLDKSGGVKGNIYKDKDGNMYVGGINYFIEFNPALIPEVSRQPKVYLSDFKIFNNSYSELLAENTIELRYYQNFFSIEFSAPAFSGNSVNYSYILAGLDKVWTDAGNRNFANYSHLPSGKYVFKVRASNEKGNWGTNSTSINIVIIPPFWQQWWFFTLCAIFISGTVYGVYRYRINELLKRQAIRNKIAQDLHDNLGSTLSSISIYSEVAKVYQQQQKEAQLQQTLEKIGATSGEMITEMSDIVWAINPKNDHVSVIIQRMESFAKPLLQAKNIAFHFNYDASVPELNLSMEKRKNFYLIFKEAINNALKYSNCKTLDVSIHFRHHTIELNVHDDGIGFDMGKVNAAASRSLSGNGLKNMKMRADEMKATFKIDSEPGKGTNVYLAFHIP